MNSTDMTKPDVNKAAQFMAASARVLDRRRMERLFGGGAAGPVRDAVAAYRNADGGFGHALEPDIRTPASQPAAVEHALRVLHEADAWDTGLARGACDWLERIAPAEGGSGFAEPTLEGWPHAPWWVPDPERRASPISTGMISGTLHAHGMSHPWLSRATELMWSLIDGLTEPGPYELRGVTRFLDHVPDRSMARQAMERVGSMLARPGLVALDPDEPGETHSPLDFAPRPDSLGRTVFGDAVIKAHLDHLAAGQQPDGGWTFNWPAWSPAAQQDWRGSLTVDALVLLRDNGRLG
jgi:hypothetical protein